MAELKNDTTSLSDSRSQLNDISLEFASAHLENFELAPPSITELYGDEKWRLEIPTGTISRGESSELKYFTLAQIQ
jgi:hypothetical protein